MTAPLRLGALVALVMTAFAANSLLNRAAVGPGQIDALTFAAVRTGAGAITLAALVLLGGRRWHQPPAALAIGALSLVTYMVCFSLAYRRLDAGVGALILFGGVQLTMFAGGVIGGERPRPARVAGALLALAGLAWMVWPHGGARIDPDFAGLMALAALGWGIYSLNGRRTTDALAATAGNFVAAAPICVLAVLVLGHPDIAPSATGIGLAVVSGAVTSGLGYALWYAVLPRLEASLAALAQLTVPVIAMAGGMALLDERVGPATLMAAALVLAGVALGSLAGRRKG